MTLQVGDGASPRPQLPPPAGRITVGACFYGPRFTAAIDPATNLPADLAGSG
jgi:hypothetical protein